MSRFKSIFLALAAVGGLLASASQAQAAPCVATAANNFCHASFNVRAFTSSSYINAPGGFTATGANTNAPLSGSNTGRTYSIDAEGYGAISLTALRNVTNQITWTFTTGGYFSFDFLISGQSSNQAKSYFIYNGGTPFLLGTGTGPATNVAGSFARNVNAGDTFTLRHVGTTLSINNSSQLQVQSFQGVPEIDGGVLPLGLLLLGVMFIAAKRRDAGEDDAGLVA